MYSFNFPNMLNGVSSNTIEGIEAVRSNMKLLLASEKMSHFGDPYFGSQLKRALFEQSSSIIVDLMIDEIYSTLITFIPQIYLTRKDITIKCKKTELFAEIRYVYLPDNVSDLYIISLTKSDNI